MNKYKKGGKIKRGFKNNSDISNEDNRECSTCFESFKLIDGLECNSTNSKHFTCDTCLNGYVKSELDLENFTKFEENNGIICPFKKFKQCDNSTKFEEQILAIHLEKEIWSNYNTTKLEIEKELKQREIMKQKEDQDEIYGDNLSDKIEKPSETQEAITKLLGSGNWKIYGEMKYPSIK